MKKISIKERVFECLRKTALSSYPGWCLVVGVTFILGVTLAAGHAAWEALVDGWQEAVSGLSRESFSREERRRQWHGKEFINGRRRCK